MEKLLLNTNKHKKAVGEFNAFNIDFYNTTNNIPTDNINRVINQYEVFDAERNACTNYRLTISPNIVASNCLAQPVTEIFDPSGNTISGDTRFNLIQTINSGYTYKFGYDIFDNHYLRLNTFKTGNTINDYDIFSFSNMLSIYNSIEQNMIDDSGWLCFYNRTKINNKKMVSWKEPNEKIDLFPTRDYFSLKPFYENNKLNNNWDYTITYPYKSEKNNILVTDINGVNGVPIFKIETGFTNELGNYVEIQTPYKHGLNSGDIIRFKNSIYQTGETFQITYIGDINNKNKDSFFRLNIDKYSQFKDLSYLNSIKNRRIVKCVKGVESEYYLRIFKKLDESLIKNLYKLGFSKNIFSDDIYQIQYIDNINLSGLTDNLGRNINEIYFTLIKRNIDSDINGHNKIFCELTSGINELQNITGFTNVRILSSNNLNEQPLENNITISGSSYGNNLFIGDIAEFNKSTVDEKIIDVVNYRFNLINREKSNSFEYHEFTTSINENLLSGGQSPVFQHNLNASYMSTTLMNNEDEKYIRNQPIGGEKVTMFGAQYDYFQSNEDYKALYVASFDVRIQTSQTMGTVTAFINTDVFDSAKTTYNVQPYTWTRCWTKPFSIPLDSNVINGLGYLIINNDSVDAVGKWVDLKNIKIEKVKFDKYVNFIPKYAVSNLYGFANDRFYLEGGKTYTLRVTGSNTNATLGRHTLVEINDFDNFYVSMSTTEYPTAFQKSITFTAPATKSYQINSYYHPQIADESGTVYVQDYYLYEGATDPGEDIAPTPWVPSKTEVSDKLLVKNTISLEPKNEGYYYIPHYKMQLKNFSKIINQGDIVDINYCDQQPFVSGVSENGNILVLDVEPYEDYTYLLLKTNAILNETDRIRISKINNNNEIYETYTTFVKFLGGSRNILLVPYDINFFGGITGINNKKYLFGKYYSPNIPSNAFSFDKNKVLWRDIQPEGIFNENSEFTNELIYTNNAFYINKTPNVYIRRQDPFGYYGLRNNNFPSDVFGNEKIDLIEDNIYKNNNTLC